MAVRDFAFNFPLTVFTVQNGYTRRGQAEQITQEAAEIFSAAERDDEGDYLMEVLDCMHACETALAEFDETAIGEAWQKVVYKNAERGYYDEHAMAAFVQDELARDAGDPVNHPSHYERDGKQTIEIVEAVIDGLPAKQAFHLGCLLKYVIRAGYKDDEETDLGKANNFAHRLCTGEWRWQHGQAKA